MNQWCQTKLDNESEWRSTLICQPDVFCMLIVDCIRKAVFHFWIGPSKLYIECACHLFLSLAAQREQYVKDKIDQVTTYKKALDAQVRVFCCSYSVPFLWKFCGIYEKSACSLSDIARYAKSLKHHSSVSSTEKTNLQLWPEPVLFNSLSVKGHCISIQKQC